MKKFAKVLIWVVVALVIVVVGLLLATDWIARTGVEKGATYALQVDTTVDGMDVGLMSGSVRMDGLNVANPEGYGTPRLMNAGTISLEVETRSLFSDTIQVRQFEIDGLDLYIERKLTTSNVEQVLENVRRFGGKSDQEQAEEGAGKSLKIDRIVIRNVVGHVALPSMGGEPRMRDVEVPPITLENLGSGPDDALLISRVVSRVFMAVVAAVIEEGGGAIPAELVADLEGQLAETAGALGEKAIEDVRRKLEGLGGEVGENLRDLIPEDREDGENGNDPIRDLLNRTRNDATDDDTP